jgi:hypothetical protein
VTEVMRIPFIEGRDFDDTDTYPGVAIVNEAFARQYFGGQNPVGRTFDETPSRGNALPQEARGRRFRVRTSSSRWPWEPCWAFCWDSYLRPIFERCSIR